MVENWGLVSEEVFDHGSKRAVNKTTLQPSPVYVGSQPFTAANLEMDAQALLQ